MSKELIFLVEEAPEGGYLAQALGYSIHTEADTWQELREAVQDAVHCHFKESDRPAMVRLHVVKDEVIPV
jgi:hypothetical protein